MCFPFFGELKRFLDRHPRLPQAAALREGFAAALAACDLEKILELYGEVLELAERLLWQEGAGEEALEASQALFREYEQLLAQRGEDERHRFVVVIPVAVPIPTIVTADSTDRDRCTHRVPTGVVFLR